MPVGNEGCGVVVAAGSAKEAQALLGRTVAIIGGATYGGVPEPSGGDVPRASRWHRLRRRRVVLRQPADGARAWSRRCGWRVTLGSCTPRPRRTSVRCCSASAWPTACPWSTSSADPSRPSCSAVSARRTCATPARRRSWTDLTAALVDTGATLAFDAIGGGRQAGQILACMEAAANANADRVQPLRVDRAQAGLHLRRPRSRADRVQPQLRHGVGHRWLVADAVPRQDRPRGLDRLRNRVVAELTTTFASHYTDEVSLAGALQPRGDQRLRPAGHRAEVPHSPVAAVTRLTAPRRDRASAPPRRGDGSARGWSSG